ncbi:hypothetical protein L1887_17908 [Cichorium endivia]|nr:hypothetical protein L1887_17908 [Cichorium endivia]
MAPKDRKPHVSMNPELIRGVGKYTCSQMYHKRGLWAIKAKNGGTFPKHEKKAAATEKPPKFYPADDIKKPLVNKRKARKTKLRARVTPGTVLIILARRVNQSYVIAMSVKVDVSGVNVDKFDDKYLGKKKTKGEGEFFEAEKEVIPSHFLLKFATVM